MRRTTMEVPMGLRSWPEVVKKFYGITGQHLTEANARQIGTRGLNKLFNAFINDPDTLELLKVYFTKADYVEFIEPHLQPKNRGDDFKENSNG